MLTKQQRSIWDLKLYLAQERRRRQDADERATYLRNTVEDILSNDYTKKEILVKLEKIFYYTQPDWKL